MTLMVDVPEKILNTEYKCSPYGAEVKKAETKWTRRFKEYLKNAWAFRSKITVEPFVICYVLPSVLAGLAVQNLALEKACLVNLHYDESTCSRIMESRTNNRSVEENNVQTLVATMTAWSYPLQTALPGILTLFLGAYSDRTGNRKSFMVIPMLGKLISIIGITLSNFFFFQVGLNETALLEGLPPALAGGRVAMTMAVYSYITDITTESERTFRLGIITAIMTLTRPVGLALSGYMTKRLGYYVIFFVACAFYLTGFIYIIRRLKPVKKTVENEGKVKCLSMFSIRDLVDTVNVAFKKRERSNRLQIFLILFAYMLIVGPVLGEAQMTYWFTRLKFKFTEVDYSLFLTYSVLIGIIESHFIVSVLSYIVSRYFHGNENYAGETAGTAIDYGSFITIYLFSKRWQMEDSIIGVIACVSRIGASLVYALAPTRTVYFLGPLLDMFSSAGAASLRSIATKLVKSDEIGKTSSLISISEALVPVIYSPIYSKVYLLTLNTMPGAFYLISAALAGPAIIILVLLLILRRRDASDIRSETEQKPKENEITTF